MDNIFSYLKESLIIGTTLVLFLVMAVAFRKIIKDVNDILDSTDKLVFFIAAFQQLLLLAYTIRELILFLSGLRILRLLQEIILLNCLIKVDTDNEQCLQKVSDKLQKLLSIALLSCWILIVVMEGYASVFQCNQQIWLLFSSLMVLISLFQLYFGINILIQIYNYWRDQGTQHMFDGLHRIMMDELQNRKVQVSIFMFCSVASATAMIIYDYEVLNLVDPFICIQSDTITRILLNVGAIIVIYQLPCLGIYYVYYYKNKKYLNNNDVALQRNIVNFCDERSEIALADYQAQQ